MDPTALISMHLVSWTPPSALPVGNGLIDIGDNIAAPITFFAPAVLPWHRNLK